MYKILFLDIDGTILKPDHTYTEKTKEAIRKAKNNGLEIFLATGRPIHEIDDLAADLDIHSYIGYNGAYAMYQNKTILDEPMNPKIVEQMVKTAKEHQHELILYTNQKNYLTSLERPIVQQFLEIFQLKQNEQLTEEVYDQILGITIMNVNNKEEADLYKLESDIQLSPVTIAGAEHSYDVIRNSVNKGEAITHILRKLQIPKESAIAFGDGMNDKQMLQAVGEGFAMGNANPDLFAYAKHRTKTVSESGVYYGLKQLGIIE